MQRWYQDPVNSVRFAGASHAEPAPGVIEAILSADAVVIAPSNPVTSIGPILSVPGIREALCSARGKVAAVSPIVGNAPVAGPAGVLMTAQGLPCSIAGVVKAYEDFLDLLVCDKRDARAAEALRKGSLQVRCTQTIMCSTEDRVALARAVLSSTIGGLFSDEPVSDEFASDQPAARAGADGCCQGGEVVEPEVAAKPHDRRRQRSVTQTASWPARAVAPVPPAPRRTGSPSR